MKSRHTATLIAAWMLVGLFAAHAAPVFAGGSVTLKGKVFDVSGEPVSGVTVTATLASGDASPVGSDTTNAKGAFSIRVKDWDLTYLLTATKEGFLEATTRIQKSPSDKAVIHMTLVEQGVESEQPAEPEEPAAPALTPAEEQRNAAIGVFNEGVDAIQAQDSATALAKFQEAASIDPSFVEAYRGIAAAAMQERKYTAAADAAERILESDPENEEAMGTVYMATLLGGDTDRMVQAADRLATVNPEATAGELLQHGSVLFEQNENARARALLEVVVKHQPDLPDAQLQLGLVCNAMGDTECAKEALGRFLELAPDHPDAVTAKGILQYLN
jgi:tetratricopeptide (TPR) repeat protein